MPDEPVQKKIVIQKKTPVRKEIKKTEISEKKKQLLDVVESLQFDNRRDEKEAFNEPLYQSSDEFETNQLNQNSGEVELALNLQSIKRRHPTNSSKYDEITHLKMQQLSTEEIAKQLNITVTEVELFNSFKDQN